MRFTAQLINNGKVTIPAQIRQVLEVEDGDLVEINVRSVNKAGGEDA